MILETKLTLPQPKPGVLLRTGLIDLIKNNLDKKLILITADAGYGKTTLLAQLAKAEKFPYLFYSLDQGDSDLAVFFSYLIVGLNMIEAGLAERSAGLLCQGSQATGSIELLMGTLINELVEKRHEEIFIILDDYHHLLGESPVHRAMEYFIDHLPDFAHVIIASRAEVQYLFLAKWMARQDVFVLSRQNLAFAREELTALFSKISVRIVNEEDALQVLRHTEGWITGIQLILSQAHGSEPGKTFKEILKTYLEKGQSAGGLFPYFAGEIFTHEPDDMKDFMIQASILETMSSSACDAILSRSDSQAMLRDLDKRNMFISRIGDREYRYHRLFRSFLQQQPADQLRLKELHQKAAEYYNLHDDKEAAIGHYLSSGEYQRTIGLIFDIFEDKFVEGKIFLLDAWINSLPETHIKAWPVLVIYKGQIRREQGCLFEAKDLFIQAERLIAKQSRKGRLTIEDHNNLAFALLWQGNLLWMEGRQPEALNILKKALKTCSVEQTQLKGNILNSLALIWQDLGDLAKTRLYLMKAKATGVRGKSAGASVLDGNLALLYYKQGEAEISCKLFEQLTDDIKGSYFMSKGIVLANAANAALVAGKKEWAENLLQEGLDLCRKYEDIRSRAAVYNSLGLLCVYKDEWDAAEKYLNNALDEFKKSQWMNSEIRAYLNLIRLYRYQGNLKQAGEYLEEAGKLKDKLEHQPGMDLEIEAAYHEIGRSNCRLAAEMLVNIKKEAERRCYRVEMFLAQLGLAAVLGITGRKKKAVELLTAAIETSKRHGYQGLLIQEIGRNKIMRELIGYCAPRGGYLDSVKKNISILGCRQAEVADRIGLNMRLFGELQISTGNGREIKMTWRSRKIISLFAYLLTNRERVCEREELMKALWPQKKHKQARQDLMTSVYWLKRNFESGCSASGAAELSRFDIILRQQKGYRLNPMFDCRVDAEEFTKQWVNAASFSEAGNEDQCLEFCRRCLELHRNGFLSNLEDQWCEAKRLAFEKKYLSCLKKVADHSLDKNEYSECIKLYEKCIKIENHLDAQDGQLHVNYWKALKARGWNSRIKKDYYRYCKTLEESDEKPDTEIKAIYYAILKTK